MPSNPRTKTVRQRVVIQAPRASVQGTHEREAARCIHRWRSDRTRASGLQLHCTERLHRRTSPCPRRAASQAWHTSEWLLQYPPSILELKLEERSGRTPIAMVHAGVPAHQAARYRKGWVQFYWEPLKAYFHR